MHAEVLSSEGDQTAPSDSSVGSENDLSRGSTANVPPGVRQRDNYENEKRPQIRRENPPNLSISVSGGKENNSDSPSSGERKGKSPAPNPCVERRNLGNVA
ncbi:hypothetical protein TNCT_154771 [Trichonephila clavata]|uniref:Uncharacterized protein n=1 Tax=Trichonephila clavata TaxID=2740835 RepID=A0A8X6LYL8_TRICU|nr:hypothetical protein TNCT_154771 [Trichonephila clavata]